MKRDGGADAAKRAAGLAAVDRIEDGDVVGLGTGSTAAFAIRAVGRRIDAGLDVRGVATSFASRELARECGIPLLELPDVTGGTEALTDPPPTAGIDVAIDGADQVADGDLIKGGGAAHAREKLVDAAADEFLVVVDRSKLAESLTGSVPVEVLPAASGTVADAIAAEGGEATVRQAKRKDGPVVTDNGNLVLDCTFGRIDDPSELAGLLSSLPGVVEHGLFVGLADAVYVGDEDGDVTVLDAV